VDSVAGHPGDRATRVSPGVSTAERSPAGGKGSFWKRLLKELLLSESVVGALYQGPRIGLTSFKKHGPIYVSDQLDHYLSMIEEYAQLQGGSIRWTSGYRSPAQQEELRRRWEAGDPNVPFEPLPYARSKHSTGRAADGEASSPELAIRLGAYAQELGLGWSPEEPWHFELR